jgi:hypothetical protein
VAFQSSGPTLFLRNTISDLHVCSLFHFGLYKQWETCNTKLPTHKPLKNHQAIEVNEFLLIMASTAGTAQLV